MNEFQNPDNYRRFREMLQSAGYNAQSLRETLGFSEQLNPRDEDIPVLLWRTREDEPLKVLIRMFVLGSLVPRSVVEGQWTAPLVEDALHAGVLSRVGDNLTGRVRLAPLQNYIFAHDRPINFHETVPADFVMGIGASTTTLAAMTIRRPTQRMLDLGCGCGTHALLAAEHSREVIASDLNPRATAFTAFNARLNNTTNVQTATGSLFEPIEGNFDLIVSNPPFVISPGGKYIYRDSGKTGDEFVRTVVCESASRLAEGGFAQILCNWAHYKNRPVEQRLKEWFAGNGCDVWVMGSETRDIATYAKTWLSSTEDTDAERYGKEFREWMKYYEREGIEHVTVGAIMLRKRTGSNQFVEFQSSPPRMNGSGGADIVSWFEARLHLNNTTDAELLEQAFEIAPAVRMRQEYRPTDGRWENSGGEISKTQGLAYSGPTDPYVSGLLARCDGRATLGELTAAMAKTIEQPVDEVASHLLPIFRDLIGKGFLIYKPR
jgi:SAM-dependent methyltransferase